MGISLKELKKNRLTPAEKWVLDLIDGAKPKPFAYIYVDWQNKDGKWLFTQNFKGGYLWVSLAETVDVLQSKFGLNDDETKELLANILYDYTDNGKLEIWY